MRTRSEEVITKHNQLIIELDHKCLALQIEASKLRIASMAEGLSYDKAEALFTEASELYEKVRKISRRIQKLQLDFYDETPKSLIKRVIAFIKYPIGR